MYSLKKLMSTMSRNFMRMALIMAATAASKKDAIKKFNHRKK
jgi:hypothetical protein